MVSAVSHGGYSKSTPKKFFPVSHQFADSDKPSQWYNKRIPKRKITQENG